MNTNRISMSNIFKIFDDVQQKFPELVILGNFGLSDQIKHWRQNKEKIVKDMKETD